MTPQLMKLPLANLSEELHTGVTCALGRRSQMPKHPLPLEFLQSVALVPPQALMYWPLRLCSVVQTQLST